MSSRLLRSVLVGLTATLLIGWGALAVAKDDKYRARQHGYEHGYRDGYHHGREDRERHAKYEVETKDYKEGDRGYDKHMGDQDEYKRGYRTGYKGGYEDAFYNRPGKFAQIYGREEVPARQERGTTIIEVRPGGYSDFAYDNGYRDGIRAGQKDLRDGTSFDPAGHTHYRDGDYGYASSLGNIEVYKRHYREGFLRGYEDGYGRSRR